MEQIILNATKRQLTGKVAKKLLILGKLPAVLYGHNVKTSSIEVDQKEFAKALKIAGESAIISLDVDGLTSPVLIHDVQRHYLKGNPIHADFYAVNMTEKLTAKIPLHFTGESAAVKALGGILAKNLTEVEVECLPADLPQFIEVDISALNSFEKAIRVSDLAVSAKVQILANPQELVVNVTAPRSEEELKALDEIVTEDVTKVEGVVKPEVLAEGEPVEGKAEEKTKE